MTERAFSHDVADPDQRRMTVQGTVNKAGIVLLVVAASAVWTWRTLSPWADDPGVVWTWILFAVVAGFAVAVVTWFKNSRAAVTGLIYAFFEGSWSAGCRSCASGPIRGLPSRRSG